MASASNYVTIDLNDLRKRFTAIEVNTVGCREIGDGSRILFYVVSDGKRLFAYNTVGVGHIIKLSKITDIRVYSHFSVIKGGRLVYRHGNGDTDVGPVTPAGVQPSDPKFDVIRKSYLKTNAGSTPPEFISFDVVDSFSEDI